MSIFRRFCRKVYALNFLYCNIFEKASLFSLYFLIEIPFLQESLCIECSGCDSGWALVFDLSYQSVWFLFICIYTYHSTLKLCCLILAITLISSRTVFHYGLTMFSDVMNIDLPQLSIPFLSGDWDKITWRVPFLLPLAV